ncbi:MAG: hypothetical protein H6837_20595 [Planctomycetes bacterium]|nr:hypothetical protein [Planctomycetota bacterium]
MTIQGEAGGVVFVSSGPGTSKEVTLDKDGKATINVPVAGGKEFTVGDGKWPKPSEVVVSVISQDDKSSSRK